MSLEEIARKAGVSRATVSRVINNHPYVSDAIRQRVQAIIEAEGFLPNGSARALARQRTEVIGVIGPEGFGSILSNFYFAILLEGISSTINQHDYVMSLWIGSTRAEMERIYKRILGYKLMDGALLLSAINDDSLPQPLVNRRVPVVMIGRSPVPAISTVDVDNVAAARAATEHLVRLGRKRVAHITGFPGLISAQERLQGYKQAMEASQLGFDPTLVIEGEYTQPSGYMAAHKLIALQADAIFAASDLIAIGAMHALDERGLAVPRDMAIIGFDDLPAASTLKPTLSTVRQPIREMGVVAVRMLIDLIEGRLTPPHRVILPTELIIRESCGML